MGKLTFGALCVGFFFAASTAQAADWTIIHAGKLLAVPGGAITENQSVIIKNGRVERVEPGFSATQTLDTADGDEVSVYDLSDYFVLPGLMDMHTHLSFEIGPSAKLESVELSEADYALRAAQFGKRTLMAGFTTVRNLGGGREMLAYRDAVNEGIAIGPRIYAVGGGISGTGGHADNHGFRSDILEVMKNPNVCDGADDCRRAVRSLVRDGADVIKITATGGVLSETGAGLNQQMLDDELRAVVETARSMGRKVAAHAHGTDGINAALKAGVNSIEHGTFLNRESIRLFRRNDAYLVPTLLAPAMFAPILSDPNSFLPAPQREKGLIALARAQQYVHEAHAGGVKIAYGTDAGVFPHGLNGKEFKLLVDWGGLTPMEAIEAATTNAAALLGQENAIGSIEPGKYGDLIAIKGDPLTDITELEDIDFVMKEGVAYKAP